MEQVEVEITGQAITARYGTLNTGDVLRTDAAFAKHLVEDCSAAKYRTTVGKPLEAENPVSRKKRDKPAGAKTELPDEAAGQVDTNKGAVAYAMTLDQNQTRPAAVPDAD